MSHSCTTSFRTDDVPVLEIQERRVGPRRDLVTVIGEVDQSTQALFQSALARTWAARPVAVVIDLRQVTFLNAGGLRTLLLASASARSRGVLLVLQSGPGQITRLLTMVGLGEQLVSPGEARTVLATASGRSRPVLRLLEPASVTDDTMPPVPAGGQALRQALRPVPTAEPVHPTGVDVLAGQALRRALESRELVGRATGVLMQRYGLTADQALGVLTDSSRNPRSSIATVAEELTRTCRPAPPSLGGWLPSGP